MIGVSEDSMFTEMPRVASVESPSALEYVTNISDEAPRRVEVRMRTSPSEEIKIGQLAIRFLLEGEASGGSVELEEFDVPAGARVPIAHSHDGYEETIYGLEGVLTWTVDGEQTEVGPGEVLCIPRGVVHRFDNDHEVDATMLAIVTPGILSPNYFREMAAVIKAATGGPPDPAALAEVWDATASPRHHDTAHLIPFARSNASCTAPPCLEPPD